jgi:hypothetical protein
MDAVAFAAVAAAGTALALASRTGWAAASKARVDTLAASSTVDKLLFVPGVPESELTLFRVKHVREQFPDAPTFPSPLLTRAWPRNQNFVE